MRLRRGALIGCLLPALAACTPPSSGAAGTGPTYTCCRAADINRDYQPGQTLTLRWTLVRGQAGTGRPPRQIELTASLTGPWATASNLKAAASPGGSPTGELVLTAEPIRASGLVGDQPVSSISIPATASPGYYNLITSVSEAGDTASGASVIRVVPGT